MILMRKQEWKNGGMEETMGCRSQKKRSAPGLSIIFASPSAPDIRQISGMSQLVILSAAEQVSAYLRGELLRGRWSGRMPGGDRLAAELGVGRDTVEAALRQMETEGLLENQGPRRGRRIVPQVGAARKRQIRVAILHHDPTDRRMDYMVELEHELELAGHTVVYPAKSLYEMGMNIGRVAKVVAASEADAWVVMAGSRELLEWFMTQEKPVLALFGRRRGLRIAAVGPDKPPILNEVTRKLVELGHRRIVLLARGLRRLPKPGASEQAFLDALKAHGILPGPYHLPDWEESVNGFYAQLESLFRVTPPTALIVDEVLLFAAAQQFLAAKGLRVPGDISLVCTDYDSSFEWSRPPISHIRWETRPVVMRILQWANHVSHGRKDLRQVNTPVHFVTGGTIGPV
jgi:DNA-binding LacI/PurR family transcriptional regulator/biotin operon repressor